MHHHQLGAGLVLTTPVAQFAQEARFGGPELPNPEHSQCTTAKPFACSWKQSYRFADSVKTANTPGAREARRPLSSLRPPWKWKGHEAPEAPAAAQAAKIGGEGRCPHRIGGGAATNQDRHNKCFPPIERQNVERPGRGRGELGPGWVQPTLAQASQAARQPSRSGTKARRSQPSLAGVLPSMWPGTTTIPTVRSRAA